MPSITPPRGNRNEMLEILTRAALDAGNAIMQVYRAGAHVTYKDDCSPVTEADQRAEDIILAALASNFPQIPVIAEESVAHGILPDASGKDFFLVDPLDGTKEFIRGHDDFTVNIALIRDGIPHIGVVYAPARNAAWTGATGMAERLSVTDDFQISEKKRIQARPRSSSPVALISRSHCTPQTEAFVAENGIREFISVGSSLKFCMLAEGTADIYPRFSRTMMWDTAAGDAILRAAGGITLDMSGNPLRYIVSGEANPVLDNPDFIAWGAPPV